MRERERVRVVSLHVLPIVTGCVLVRLYVSTALSLEKTATEITDSLTQASCERVKFSTVL